MSAGGLFLVFECNIPPLLVSDSLVPPFKLCMGLFELRDSLWYRVSVTTRSSLSRSLSPGLLIPLPSYYTLLFWFPRLFSCACSNKFGSFYLYSLSSCIRISRPGEPGDKILTAPSLLTSFVFPAVLMFSGSCGQF